MNSTKDTDKQYNLSPKMLFTLIFALLITLFFLYFAYTGFVQKKNIVSSRIDEIIKQDTSSNSMFFGNIITGSHIDVLNKDVRSNNTLQKLKSYRVDSDLKNSGNVNPFKPIETPVIERPSPRVMLPDIAPLENDVR
jgi:hypothetical protein